VTTRGAQPIPQDIDKEYPDVTGVFTEWIARQLPRFRAFEVLFTGILRWNANRIQFENIVVALGEPQNGFVSSRKALGAVQAVLEMPNDPIA
jgi:hypothetical protein